MENFMKMLSTQAILLVYMAVGFYCRKRGIIEKKMQGKLTDFVLRITLPCMIFNSFSMHITLDMLKQAALCLGVAFFICFAAWLGGKVVYNMYPKEKKSVLQYATLVNNAAFLGLPIVKAVLGEAGVSIFTAEADKKAAFKKVMLNPCVIVIFIGLFRSFTDFTLPEFLAKSITGLGNCTTPLSMVLIGTMMTELTPASFKDWSTVYLAFMRLVALPFLALFIMRLLNADPIMTGCAVILTAMPAGSTTALLAEKYGSDPVYASKCLLTNTLFSLITIPIMTLFI